MEQVKDYAGKLWQCERNDIISDHEAEEQYEEVLNECYPLVSVCGYEYEAGRILKEVDPIAFRCGFCDWASEELIEIQPLDTDMFEPSRCWYAHKDMLQEVETEESAD